MKRILFVSDAASVHTRRWAEYFRDQGAEVHVASFRPSVIDGVTVHRLGASRFGKVGYLLAVPALRALVRRLKPQMVHAQYVTSYGFLAALAGLRPLVVTAWGTDVLISPRESVLLRRLASYAVRHADAVTTVAEHMNPSVAELGVPLDTIVATPFGVDTQLFLPPKERAEGVPLRLICTRNFAPVYSVNTLIEALGIVARQGMALEVELVGAGPLEGELRAQVEREGLVAQVRWRGHVDHPTLARMLSEAQIFVTPAVSDGNNVSLNEAMACASFPIATAIPANTQWIDDGVNGLLFPAGDAARLAQCILLAAGEPSLRTRAGVLNRAIIEQRADWRICVQRMLQTYSKAAVHAGLPL